MHSRLATALMYGRRQGLISRANNYLTVMLMILISSNGFSSFGCVFTLLICCTTSIPLMTRPNTVCTLFNHGCMREEIEEKEEEEEGGRGRLRGAPS